MQCEMCGKEARLFKTRIEGTVLNVCRSCSAYGEVISEVKREVLPKRKIKPKKPEPEVIFIVDENYPQIIKERREKLGLKQEELARKISEKESVINKLESGSMIPNLKLAKKLERFLKVKLISEELAEVKPSPQQSPKLKETYTMGDFITIK